MTPEIYIGLSDKGQLAWRIKALHDAFFIIHIVAEHFGITEEILISVSRKREITKPRQIATYCLCEMTTMPLVKIGNLFGQDHSTVIYSRDEVKDKMDVYPDFKREIQGIQAKIRELFDAEKN